MLKITNILSPSLRAVAKQSLRMQIEDVVQMRGAIHEIASSPRRAGPAVPRNDARIACPIMSNTQSVGPDL